MDRRELLKMIGVLTGGAVIGGESFLTGCKSTPGIGGATFNAADIAFLDEVADTIFIRLLRNKPGHRSFPFPEFSMAWHFSSGNSL